MAHSQGLLLRARGLLMNYELAGIEYHHNQKKDAPSGTAKHITQTLEMKTPSLQVSGVVESLENMKWSSIPLLKYIAKELFSEN